MGTSVMENLEAVLKNFTFQELCDIALQEFPETTWDEIKNFILIHSQQLNNKNVIKVLLNIVKEDVPKEEIENRTSNLLLLAIGKSHKRTWVSFQLINAITVAKREILENIKSSIRRTGMLANVHLIKYDNKFMLSVEKKIISKKRGIQKQLPIFFQFFLNEPYLFSNRTSIENKLMTAIVEALGYSNWKLCGLTGRNTIDLLTLLKNKTGTTTTHLSLPEPEQTSTVSITKSATEFGQRDERKRYANQIFGENPPQLQNLSVSLKNTTWQQTDYFDKMNGTALDGAMKISFRAPNIAEYFKEMITAGVVSEPIPEYMKAVLYAGKNNLKITHKK